MSGDNMTVVIGQDIQKEGVRIDTNGNQIDPRTKQIIKPREKEYVPEPEVVQEPPAIPTSDLSITEQIKLAEQHLADLNVLKKAEIERKRQELAELEANE